MAPYLVVIGFIATFAVIPFGPVLVIADLDIGILYITAVTGLVVVGVLMAGWSSNNKWSLLGGIRSAAQIVSYEIPAGLSIFPIVLLTGTLSMQGIIRAQGWTPWQWFLFHDPFTFTAFFVFFVAALAEGNRTPFDLPEAESELVAGFCTEYSGMRYLLFFLAEWGNLYVIGAIVTTLFLGGWQVPPVTTQPVAADGPPAPDVLLEGVLLRVHRHVGARDLAARARRPADDALLEVHGADRARERRWYGDLDEWSCPTRVGRVVAFAMTLGTAAAVVLFFRRVRFHLQRARLAPSTTTTARSSDVGSLLKKGHLLRCSVVRLCGIAHYLRALPRASHLTLFEQPAGLPRARGRGGRFASALSILIGFLRLNWRAERSGALSLRPAAPAGCSKGSGCERRDRTNAEA